MIAKKATNASGRLIGQDHPRARYTNREVELVLDLKDQRYGTRLIAKMMDMPRRTVRDICKGRIRCQTEGA